MRHPSGSAKTIEAWTSLPGRIRRSVASLSSRDLDRRGGSEGWSIRGYAHHLVEANLIASNIVLAALAKPNC